MAWLSDKQICTMYRDSANREEQIKILSELTLYSVERVVAILRAGGYDVAMPKRRYSDTPVKKTSRRWTADEYLIVWRLFNEGASLLGIAKECNRSTRAIKCALNGLQKRPGYIPTAEMLTALRLYEKEAAR